MWQQVFDPACRVGGQSLEDILQVRVGIVPVDACRVDQAHDRCGALARSQAAGEQPVAPSECNRSDLVLNPIVRDRHVTVLDVPRQCWPALEAVVDRFDRGRTWRNLLPLQEQPFVEQRGHPSRFALANSSSFVWGKVAEIRLDLEQRLEVPQRLFANPGDRIEWSVVNMVDGSDVPVTITWPESGPWGKEPMSFRSNDRQTVSAASGGRFKYVVSALDAQEDPEVEIPDV
jgi:hypothetical protein